MAKVKPDSINISIFTALKVSELSKVPTLIMSNPGVGKSTTVAMFAEIRGYHLNLLRGNSTSAEEILGYDMAPQTEAHSKSTIHLRPSWFQDVLEKHEQGIPTLLFLDEITTNNEYVQAALLHLIFERMVGMEKLPDNCLIVSAGNYAQNLSNQANLLPPLMNRFLIFNVVPKKGDLKQFLCKYSGALASETGEPEDYMKELYEVMKEMDSQQLKLDRGTYNRVGEYIERSILQTAEMLERAGNKPLDLATTDLRNLYSDLDGQDELLGFCTPRTLCYLRDVAIASYVCFGKAGLQSDNFLNQIKGLCGIAISRTGGKDNEPKRTPVYDEFFKAIGLAASDIEKLNSSIIPQYLDYLKKFTNERSFEEADLVALSNKISEMLNDSELAKIDRPIESGVWESIIQNIVKTATEKIKINKASVGIKTMPNGQVLFNHPDLSIEEYTNNVFMWNHCVKSLEKVMDFVRDPARKYVGVSTELTSLIDNSIQTLNPIKYRLTSQRGSISSDPDVIKGLAKIETIKDKFAKK